MTSPALRRVCVYVYVRACVDGRHFWQFFLRSSIVLESRKDRISFNPKQQVRVISVCPSSVFSWLRSCDILSCDNLWLVIDEKRRRKRGGVGNKWRNDYCLMTIDEPSDVVDNFIRWGWNREIPRFHQPEPQINFCSTFEYVYFCCLVQSESERTYFCWHHWISWRKTKRKHKWLAKWI